jgi:hypothetical protein
MICKFFDHLHFLFSVRCWQDARGPSRLAGSSFFFGGTCPFSAFLSRPLVPLSSCTPPRAYTACLCFACAFGLCLITWKFQMQPNFWLTTRLRPTLWLPPRLDVIEQSAVCGI